jgi:DNA-binding MarR family transcriptional regulator
VTGPGDCACLRLRKITRRVTQLYDHFLARSGLTATQFGLLSFIADADRISIGALAAELVTDPTTLTRNLRPLEQARYVAVVPDPADRRRRTVTLTRDGRAVLSDALPLWRQAQAHVVSLVGRQRLQALKASLDQALERLGSE